MTSYFPRAIESAVLAAQLHYPVTLVTGPRQSGKSTLCRHLFPDYKYVNLENISERVTALANPVGYLDSLGDNAVIDEVQNVPELLSMIQVRVDGYPEKRFILTGSCNFTLAKTVSQSLAGRVAQFTLLPFSFPELPAAYKTKDTDTIMLNGFYPQTAIKSAEPTAFFTNYYNTYVERDIRDLLKVKNLLKFDTFMRLLAARCGSELNASQLAKEAGVSSPTISEWMSLLSASYITFQLPPFHANIAKRLTKMPKTYFTDTGFLCYLLGFESVADIRRSQLRGAVFENMAISELIKRRFNAGKEPRIMFYRESSGREVDAIVPAEGGKALYEIKSGQTLRPDSFANMKYAASLLPDIVSCEVIYDGESTGPALNVREI